MTALSHWLVQICASHGPKLPCDVQVLRMKRVTSWRKKKQKKKLNHVKKHHHWLTGSLIRGSSWQTFCSDFNFCFGILFGWLWRGGCLFGMIFFSLEWTFSFNGSVQLQVSTDENSSDKMQCWKAVQSGPNPGASTELEYDTVQLS